MDTHTQKVGTTYPGLFLILIDQSYSMDGQKAKNAADAVNRVIYEIVIASRKAGKVLNRCYLGVIGYGAEVKGIVGNDIPVIADTPLRVERGEKPIWVDPVANNGTPMAEALAVAYKLAAPWAQEHRESFPPIVFNITDGAPNDFDEKTGDAGQTRTAAENLMAISTDDGGLLLFNVHVAEGTQSKEFQFPSTVNGLPDSYARFLFSISSILPNTLLEQAKMQGLASDPGARGFAFNATGETLVKLIIFGSTAPGLIEA